MNELPEHVQAVLDTAIELMDELEATRPTGQNYGPHSRALIDAIEAYRKAETPEPFEMFAHWYEDGFGPVMSTPSVGQSKATNIWRCTVTPIERVR